MILLSDFHRDVGARDGVPANLLMFQRSKIYFVSTETKEVPDKTLRIERLSFVPLIVAIILPKVYLEIALLGSILYFFRCKVLPIN